MRPLLFALALAGLATPALAALAPGAPAPDFRVDAALGGKVHPFDLSDALKRGPVVLYFFPSAFTDGCTIEAREFAEAMDDFKAAGASVIGMTAGNVARLAEFSVSECRSKFPVGAATPQLIRAYDSVLALRPQLSNRTSYVITPDGKIYFAHNGMNPLEHIETTLAAVRRWRAAQR